MMTTDEKVVILSAGKENEGVRIDKFIIGQVDGISRNYLHTLFEQNLVFKGDTPISKSYRPKDGDVIKVILKPKEPILAVPQKIDIPIVYEDDTLLVVNKPKGMVVHPAAGNPDGTLVNALLYHCAGHLSKVGGEVRPGIVHRIDKDTSGLLVVAKDDFAHKVLSEQISSHKFKRLYSAVVRGTVKEDRLELDMPIGRSRYNRKKMAVTFKNSKRAVTQLRVLKRYRDYTHVSLRLLTGRTHQIRVHMAHIGHPVAGDVLYGKGECKEILHGQCLHAQTIEFIHPKTNERLEFKSDLPEYFVDFLNVIAP